jgi:glycosyltransferase involved in cell wall biosynthesis
MADVLDELVRNHELRRQMSTNARTLLTTRLSLRVLGEKFTALCDKKLG